MQKCVEYYDGVLNAPRDNSVERREAINVMLETMVNSISGSDAQRMETPF